MFSSTNQPTTVEPTAFMNSRINRMPKTPSSVLRDNFDLTPNTHTAHSFHKSGYHSSGNGPRGSAGYDDFILFPDVEKGISGNEFLDTSRFYQDADEVVRKHKLDEEEPSSLEFPRPNENHRTYTDQSFSTVNQILQSTTISSPHLSSPPPPPSPHLANLQSFDEVEETSMLEIWQRSPERHEAIAYQFEQPPYAQREHLLPLLSQSPRVRRSGNGNARRARGNGIRRRSAAAGP